MRYNGSGWQGDILYLILHLGGGKTANTERDLLQYGCRAEKQGLTFITNNTNWDYVRTVVW